MVAHLPGTLTTAQGHEDRDTWCPTANLRDAQDDTAEIISQWYDLLLQEYNAGLPRQQSLNSYGDMFRVMRRESRIVDRVTYLASTRWGITKANLDEMNLFKHRQNLNAHKEKWNPNSTPCTTQQEALVRLRVGSLTFDSQIARSSFERCVTKIVGHLYI